MFYEFLVSLASKHLVLAQILSLFGNQERNHGDGRRGGGELEAGKQIKEGGKVIS